MKFVRVAAGVSALTLVTGLGFTVAGASMGATTATTSSCNPLSALLGCTNPPPPPSGGPSTVGNPPLPATSACGPTIRKANGTPWRCTFVDTFSGTQLNRNFWVPQTGYYQGDFKAGYNCYIDSPSVISVSGSALHLRIIEQGLPTACGAPAGATNYVGGMISTYHLFSQRYGRFQARVKVQAANAPGLHEAFWLWPDDRYTKVNWPATGEIDPSETFSMYHDRSVAFLHYAKDAHWVSGVNMNFNCRAQRGNWNTYTVSWSPKSLTVQINGKTCLLNKSGDPAFKERYIMLLTAALGESKNKMTANTPIPATMLVDYVKVWL